jgi:hypothetical protein
MLAKKSNMKGDQKMNSINFNQFEMLSPVISASLINAFLTKKLIAVQKGEEIDEVQSLQSLISTWLELTAQIDKYAPKAAE